MLTPLLRNAVDAETSHKIAVKVLKSGLAPKDRREDDKVLETEVSPFTIWMENYSADGTVVELVVGDETIKSHWRRCRL